MSGTDIALRYVRCCRARHGSHWMLSSPPSAQVNPELKGHFEDKGFRFVGQDIEGERMEVIELDGKHAAVNTCPGESGLLLTCLPSSDHPYFVGVQYHPEFTSRPIKPSPPYLGLLLASAGKLQSYLQKGCRLSPR